MTTYTTSANLPKPAVADTGWGTTLNAALDTIDAQSAIGPFAVTLHEIPSTTLNVKVAAGTYIDSTGAYVSYAGSASFAITTASTQNLWLTNAGVLTQGAAWPGAGVKCVRLATIVAGATTITSITDARVFLTSAG